MNAINWTELYESHSGEWVALADDEETVISSGDTLEETLEQAREQGVQDPIVHKVPDRPESIVGHQDA